MSLHSLISEFLTTYRTICSRTSYVRYIQNSASAPQNQQSLTVSYLTNSCGFSLQRAIEASKYVNIEKIEKPEKVLQLFTDYGFTKSQITKAISAQPALILADPVKTLKPKIEFLESLGILRSDLPRVLCADGRILFSSLKNKIFPTVDFLRKFLETDENVICALMRWPGVLAHGVKRMMLNIDTLRVYGVPQQNMKNLFLAEPRVLLSSLDSFKEAVEESKVMGFDPMRMSFLYAIQSMSIMSKSTWLRKKELFLSFGWSEGEFHKAFRLQPFLMLTSEKKIKELMDFFLTKLNLEPSDLVKCPNLFLTSLQRRLIPRCSILEVLMSKGLVEKDAEVIWILNASKKKFEDRFFNPYKGDFPELIKAYQHEIGFTGSRNEM